MKRFTFWVSAFFLLAATAACTPVTQEYAPLTASPRLTREALQPGTAQDALPLRSWLPASSPHAVIIALHGFNDYSKAFDIPGEYFRKRGIAVYAYDQRGFGEAPHTGYWGGENNYTRDLAQMVRAVKKKHPRTPIYLLGESMGGAIVISALSEPDFPQVQGAVLVSPAVWGGAGMGSFYRGMVWTMAHVMPGAKFTGQGLKIRATDNIPLLREMSRDPLIIKETRADAIYGIVNLMGSAYEKAPQVEVPLFVLYGAQDQVIPAGPMVRMAKNLNAPNIIAVYPENYHMMLRDLAGEVPMNDITSWVSNRKKPLPSGFDKDWEEQLKKKKKPVIAPRARPQ